MLGDLGSTLGSLDISVLGNKTGDDNVPSQSIIVMLK